MRTLASRLMIRALAAVGDWLVRIAYDWVAIRHRLALTGLLSLTVAAVFALSISDGGMPVWLVWVTHVGLAVPVVVLWVVWAHVERQAS